MKKTMCFSSFTAFLCSALITFSAHAENLSVEQNSPFEALEPIHKLVTDHVKQKIGQDLIEPSIQLRKLSPSLKLKKCLQPIEIIDRNPNDTIGRMTISATCAQPKWRVFVPVQVNGKKIVIKTTKGILKKAVITTEDVTETLVPYKRVPRGAMTNLEKVIGMRTKQAIGPDSFIKVRQLQPPYWVFKNQAVNIVTQLNGIEVRTKGTALKSGVVDEQIPVKNSSSKKIIKGIVIAPNTVLVP